MLQVTLEINRKTTQIQQMAEKFHLNPDGNTIEIPAFMGTGAVRYYGLPYDIQVHHYRYKLKQQIEVTGNNPEDTGLYMLNINLSNRVLKKQVGGDARALSRSGKAGMIFYSPGYNSRGSNEVDQEFEVVFFAFPKDTLEAMVSSDRTMELAQKGPFCVYTELSDTLEQSLREALKTDGKANRLVIQGKLMEVLGRLIEEVGDRKYLPDSKLNLQDVERQFKVKEIVMQHIFGNLPTIDDIASEVHTSKSKLKSDFKSLFGNSIYQYYLARKMETARDMVSRREGTVSEIGYQLGYTNVAQFSAQFKKHFGVTPSKYGSGGAE